MVDAEVIERLKTLQDRYEPCGDYYKALGIAIKRMGEPERLTAKWIMHSGGRQITHAECSNCGMKNYVGVVNYCPMCGAKMEVDE